MQMITDCNTGVLVAPNTLIQPAPGCDSWETNRFERPFNAGSQDEYFPDLDIIQAELGEADGWFYLRIEIYDLREGEDYPLGTYAIELDLDQDMRGDALVLVMAPGLDGDEGWSVAGVQVWEDSDQTVGYMQPAAPDHPVEEDGYDLLLFDNGLGSNDPDVAWARFSPGEPTIVEIAFKSSLINNDAVFLWWVWAQQDMNPTQMDYHDTIEHEDAGDVYEAQMYFPSQDIYEVDNTCKALWGAPPDEDPSLCVNDPNVPQPTPGAGTPVFTPPANVTRTATPTDPGDGSLTPTPTPTATTPRDRGGCVDDNGSVVTCTPTPTDTPRTPDGDTTPTDTPRTPDPSRIHQHRRRPAEVLLVITPARRHLRLMTHRRRQQIPLALLIALHQQHVRQRLLRHVNQ